MVVLSMRYARCMLLLLGLSAAGLAVADEPATPSVVSASVHVRGDWLHADVRLRDLIDDRTASTIDSGLSGVCAYEVAVLGPNDEVVGRRVWTLRLEHDLWEDRYLVASADRELALPSLAAMDSVCSHVHDLRLAPLARFEPGEEYRLVVAVEVLPLGAEAQDRLSRYISRRGDTSRRDVDLDLGSLFGRLFTGRDAGRASLSHRGPAFRADTLERRP
jgi:hypothetical protein